MTAKLLGLNLSFRAARAGDLDAVRSLHALAFASLAASHHSAAEILAHTRLTEAPDYIADLAESHLMLALTPGGEIVASAGWIGVAEELGVARIRKVFVHPSLARRGLASFLVRDAERRAAAAGYTKIIVRANLNAVPLYAKLGYRPLRSDSMATPSGVALPVLFMENAAGRTEP